jgi:hypothetical protein
MIQSGKQNINSRRFLIMFFIVCIAAITCIVVLVPETKTSTNVISTTQGVEKDSTPKERGDTAQDTIPDSVKDTTTVPPPPAKIYNIFLSYPYMDGCEIYVDGKKGDILDQIPPSTAILRLSSFKEKTHTFTLYRNGMPDDSVTRFINKDSIRIDFLKPFIVNLCYNPDFFRGCTVYVDGKIADSGTLLDQTQSKAKVRIYIVKGTSHTFSLHTPKGSDKSLSRIIETDGTVINFPVY